MFLAFCHAYTTEQTLDQNFSLNVIGYTKEQVFCCQGNSKVVNRSLFSFEAQNIGTWDNEGKKGTEIR